jgi:hypothetical protein
MGNAQSLLNKQKKITISKRCPDPQFPAIFCHSVLFLFEKLSRPAFYYSLCFVSIRKSHVQLCIKRKYKRTIKMNHVLHSKSYSSSLDGRVVFIPFGNCSNKLRGDCRSRKESPNEPSWIWNEPRIIIGFTTTSTKSAVDYK